MQTTANSLPWQAVTDPCSLQGKSRYAEIADMLGLGGEKPREKVAALITAIEELKAQCGVPVSHLTAPLGKMRSSPYQRCPRCGGMMVAALLSFKHDLVWRDSEWSVGNVRPCPRPTYSSWGANVSECPKAR